ncbi:glucosylglycerol hydrolase [Natranaeroarchaeum sulfidigenes]|uniref:Alpha-amylase n=1 Tax=Natranaeroarchaeum sulfidigenes TaxID=2784880 RepID=A0A897MUA1_9EURY|nr:glucosylglycerol hydrolase [Natranaeroarchaeum sulfidigenes]QSG02623.1 hypothetical protein AArcS_1408 [Natranaeroarchaeum sulfidigenes]
MSENTTTCTVHDTRTKRLCEWTAEQLAAPDDPFDAAKAIVERLGAHLDGDIAEFGFWTPELLDDDIEPENVYLELFTPVEEVDPGAEEATSRFRHERVPTQREGEYTWAAVEGVQAGTRDSLGSLYRLTYETDGGWETIQDPLAYSVPFGAYAPAELYDIDALDTERADREYFESLGNEDEPIATSEHDGLPRVDPATNLLELHPGTASAKGSLAGLTRRYEEIARKQREGEELTPMEQNFAGYDGVQVMPIAPITEGEYQPDHFEIEGDLSDEVNEIEITTRSPNMVNWGYDIVISGFSAVNPGVLETGRPDELVDFIATLHGMPEPMRVVFDIALGHADDGAIPLLNDYFFEGPGMYGQELDYRHPTVRAILLELQRRKMNWGADGIRVDGAQDFTYWDPETEEEYHDDEYLAAMDEVTQVVAGTEYRPWMIYEDGRPWPEEDWELASTYRELIEEHPHSFQWGPVTFAHNTPAILTFWASKWWRVEELADMGDHWISGVANHDTMRRGAQVEVGEEWDATQENPYLSDTLRGTIERAYDNPASNMLMYCFLPGVPMDFTHANARAPWYFVRDTDDTWNVKVVANGAYFVDWYVTEEAFTDSEQFTRLKELGFETLDGLRDFGHTLAAMGEAVDYDLDELAPLLDATNPPLGDGPLGPGDLESYALAWMRDVAEFANLSHYEEDQDADRTAFDLRVREFRHERPWLRETLADGEVFDYRHPTDQSVVYYGCRSAPDGSEELLFVANMEGRPATVTPTELAEVSERGWEVALATPTVDVDDASEQLTLDDSEAVVFSRTI